MSMSRANKVTYGILFTAAAVSTIITIDDWTDGEYEIEIAIPTEQYQAFKQGNGDTHKLYELFAKEVDPLVMEGGQSATVEITADGETKTFQHIPKTQF